MSRKLAISCSILLLLLLAAPGAYWLMFLAQRQIIAHAMERRMEQEKLVAFKLRSEEIVWHKPGKEIVLQGKLFDVKSIQRISASEYLIAGLFDEQEQELHRTLNAEVQHRTKSGMNAGLVLAQFSIAYFACTVQQINTSCEVQISPEFNLVIASDLATNFFDVISPPPQASLLIA